MTRANAPWPTAPLSDALEALIDHRGKTPGKLGGDFQAEGVPVISAIHIKDGRVDFAQRERFVSSEMFERWMPERLRAGDVLMTSEAPLGSLALVPTDGPLVLSQRLFALRGKGGVLNNRFLRWFLEAPPGRAQIDKRSSGTTVTGIRQAELRQVEIPLPPVGVQRWIVDMLEDQLSRLDAATRELTRSFSRSNTLRASVLHREIVGTPRALGELALTSGYGTSTKCSVDGPGLPVARIPNLTSGTVDMTDEKRALDPGLDISGLLLRRGDLLIVRTNGSRELIGRSAVVESDMNVAFASYLIRYRFDEQNVLPGWVHFALESPTVRTQLETLAASSAGQHNLGLKKLDRLLIPCPRVGIQADVLRRVQELEDGRARLQKTVRAQLLRTNSLRRALLAVAFEGNLTGRPTDAEMVEELAGV